MSVPIQQTVFRYVANGATKQFAYECYVIEADDLVVYVNGARQSSGYTVSGVGNQNGGDVIFSSAPPKGVRIRIERDVSIKRENQYQYLGDFRSPTVNDDFDRLWMVLARVAYFLGLYPGQSSRALILGPDDIDGAGAYRAHENRIANLGDPIDAGDAVNLKTLLLKMAESAEVGPGQSVLDLLASATGSSFVGFMQAGAGAVRRTLQDKARERVSVDDYFEVGDADHTEAFVRATNYLKTRGGGIIECPGPLYVARGITVPRFVLIEGRGAGATELRCAGGVNTDFITSESFAALTGSGLDVVGDARVPSWFGLRALRVNGNRDGNTQGRGVAFYGANIIIDDVLIQKAAGDGLYTEYAASISGLGDWRAQEEGYVRNLVVRENGGVGWRNRGPHNVHMDNIVGCLNDDWGYVSEIAAGVYNGAPTYCSVLHCYSNDMKWTPDTGRVRRNMYIGVNMSCALLVVDGGHCEVRGSSSLIAIVKQYFGGQGGDALLLSGSDIKVGTHYGIMRNDSVSQGSAVLRISGNYNQIGTSQVLGTLNRFDGVIITGVGNTINDLIARECRTGLTVTGSQNRVRGLLIRNANGFRYQRPTDVYGGYNRIELRIYHNTAGATYVSGDAPIADRDVFDVQANGLPEGSKATRSLFQVGALPIDTDVAQYVTIPHRLLWPCRTRDVRVTMTGLSVAPAQFAYCRVRTVTDTEIEFSYRCNAASSPGGQVTFAFEAQVN
ncbi:hypothetical protein [Burkholderia stagnalis]|uniref:hypothetical protein n=1 Tax=Burkholderia stagnalis TaxID=1503054 RepID=UPI00075FD56C|nr:hypothetical protein [Burkholderia stagnalis]KWK63316.1 hypothetical protein WT82_23820 [Burkholderia stagnalis]